MLTNPRGVATALIELDHECAWGWPGRVES